MKTSIHISDELKTISPLLAGIEKINVFSVPEGYFDALSNNILLRCDTVSEIAGFTVPDGYFDGLADQILARIRKEESASPTKVVAMPRRRNILRYAAAAMVTGIMATSGWWIVNQTKDQNGEKAAVNAYIKESRKYNSVQKIEEGIDKIPDEAIISYLEATGTDADNELLANNINEQELPSQTDYLLNEKTLDTYLNEIDSKIEN